MDLEENLIQRVNVADTLRRSAAARPTQVAIVDGDRRWSYAELDGWVDRLARGLARRGYTHGDVLALASGNSAEFLAVYYACGRLGLVCVPINLGWRPDEVAYVLSHSRARGLVVESQLVETMAEALAPSPDVAEVIVAPGTGADWASRPADRSWSTLAELEAGANGHGLPVEVFVADRDPLSYLYTSGTTGAPKGVVGTHLGIYLESTSAALDNGWNAADRFLAMMPMFHTAQLNAFCTPALLLGASIHVHRGFEQERFLETVEREGITQVFGLPMMYRAALEHPRSPAGTSRRCVGPPTPWRRCPRPRSRRASTVSGASSRCCSGRPRCRRSPPCSARSTSFPMPVRSAPR
jgi:acyl-CoA synthetase (AMP-forming)/AMP-acid ligase II